MKIAIFAAMIALLFGCENTETTEPRNSPGTLIHAFAKVCPGRVYLKTFDVLGYSSAPCSGETRTAKMFRAIEKFSKGKKILNQKNIYSNDFLWYVELTVCEETKP